MKPKRYARAFKTGAARPSEESAAPPAVVLDLYSRQVVGQAMAPGGRTR